MDANTIRQVTHNYAKETIDKFLSALNEGERQGYRMVWSFIKQYLLEHWSLILLIIFGVILIAFIIYIFTGRWAVLGSVIYHYVYIIFLSLLTILFGPEVFASEYIKIVLFIIYVVCFVLVEQLFKRT